MRSDLGSNRIPIMPRKAIYILSAILLLEAAIIFGQLRMLTELRTTRDTAANVEQIKRKTKELVERKVNLVQSARTARGRIMGETSTRVLTPEENRRFQRIRAEQKSPECDRLTRIEELAELRIRYTPLIRKLKFDAERANKLLSLLSDQQDLPMDMNKASVDQHVSMDDFRKHMSDEKSQIETAIEDTIGRENVPQLDFYQSHQGPYLLVSELQQVLGVNADHLSDAQADALTKILLGNPSPDDAVPGIFTPYKGSVVIPFLTPSWYRGDAYSSGLPPGGQPNTSAAGFNFITRPSGFAYIDATGSIDSNCGLSDATINAAAIILSADQLSSLQAIKGQQIAEREMANAYNTH